MVFYNFPKPGWDSDMSTLLLLLHILSPQPAGRKRGHKISASDAIDHLVVFRKVCNSGTKAAFEMWFDLDLNTYYCPFFHVPFSHARVWMNIWILMNVNSRICLPLEPPNEPSAPSTSSWIRSSSHARETHLLQHSMNFSRSILSLV